MLITSQKLVPSTENGTMKNPIATVDSLIRERIARNMEIKEALLADSTFHSQLGQIAGRIISSLRAGGKVVFFGNGGSAADGQHLAAEFTGRYLKERRALPALALNANTSSLTAIGNDYGFEQVFARQIEALGREGDVAIGITTSGTSPNIVRGLEVAKSKRMYTVALTGKFGDILRTVADCVVCIPCSETPRIQECHILAGHIICEIVDLAFCTEPHSEAPDSCETRAVAVRMGGNR
jgi:D-sedoheptulose 7-phosphate isomerase